MSERAVHTPRPGDGKRTVASLRPKKAIVMRDTISVREAAVKMAAEKADATLLVDASNNLSGILTDKDLMSRVVAESINPDTCLVSLVMTRNPSCVSPNDVAMDALITMVEGRFRHLPVVQTNELGNSQVVGLLDITRCLHDAIAKLEQAVSGDKTLAKKIESIERELERSGVLGHHELGDASQTLLESLRSRIRGRMCGRLVEQNSRMGLPFVSVKATVSEAAQTMKKCHSSAVLVLADTEDRKLMGIFTTKDILSRIVAQNVSTDTQIIKAMTAFPDTVLPTTTVLEALERMQRKHYLHLPVANDAGQVLGLVDVLQLSLDVLEGDKTVDSGGFDWARSGMLALASIREDDMSSVCSFTSHASDMPSVAAGGGGGHHPTLDRHTSESTLSSSKHESKSERRTVARLRPKKAIVLKDTGTVLEVVKAMAAQKEDAALLTSESGELSGIITDKDLMARVIAEGIDPASCPVSLIMTRNPSCVGPNDAALDALAMMVEGRFRHLPVTQRGLGTASSAAGGGGGGGATRSSQVVGVLDITRCLKDAINKLEQIVSGDKSLVKTIESLEKELGTGGASSNNNNNNNNNNVGGEEVSSASSRLIESLRTRIKGRSCGHLIDQSNKYGTPEVTMKATVFEAAKVMKKCHTSAVVVLSESDDRKLMGIFTTKDILSRVVAQGLSPDTRIIKAMTMFPDTIPPTTTVLQALEIIHQKRYLHLPVVSDTGKVLGLVDVLQLTLDVINPDQLSGGGGGSTTTANVVGGTGSMPEYNWHNVVEFAFQRDDDTFSVGSDMLESASMVSAPKEPLMPAPQDGLFTFKVRSDQNKLYRFTSSCDSLAKLREHISNKMKLALDQVELCTISYIDDNGDAVVMEDDADLRTGVDLAKSQNWSCLNLTISDPHIKEDSNSNNNNNNGSSNSVNNNSNNQTPSKQQQQGLQTLPLQQVKPDNSDSVSGYNAGASPRSLASSRTANSRRSSNMHLNNNNNNNNNDDEDPVPRDKHKSSKSNDNNADDDSSLYSSDDDNDNRSSTNRSLRSGRGNKSRNKVKRSRSRGGDDSRSDNGGNGGGFGGGINPLFMVLGGALMAVGVMAIVSLALSGGGRKEDRHRPERR